jgi:hypothetical protein
VAALKFTYGKKQKVDGVELDRLFTDLQTVLREHPLVPSGNIEALISEWINDILFVAGKITEQELQEAMQTFETAETEGPAKGESSDEDEGEDEDDED